MEAETRARLRQSLRSYLRAPFRAHMRARLPSSLRAPFHACLHVNHCCWHHFVRTCVHVCLHPYTLHFTHAYMHTRLRAFLPACMRAKMNLLFRPTNSTTTPSREPRYSCASPPPTRAPSQRSQAGDLEGPAADSPSPRQSIGRRSTGTDRQLPRCPSSMLH
jgi:hypothetical protein